MHAVWPSVGWWCPAQWATCASQRCRQARFMQSGVTNYARTRLAWANAFAASLAQLVSVSPDRAQLGLRGSQRTRASQWAGNATLLGCQVADPRVRSRRTRDSHWSGAGTLRMAHERPTDLRTGEWLTELGRMCIARKSREDRVSLQLTERDRGCRQHCASKAGVKGTKRRRQEDYVYSPGAGASWSDLLRR